MDKELLSICIPTRNRSHLLKDLLASIASEITAESLTPADVKVYVSDNASTDATRDVVLQTIGTLPHLVYSVNETNIGGNLNIIACYEKSHGHYRWIIGDDEILMPGSLKHVLHILRTVKPAWLLNNSNQGFGRNLGLPRKFDGIRDYLIEVTQHAPELIMMAGAICVNVFREDCYAVEVAKKEVVRSNYSQYFALMQGLHRQGGPVYLTEVHTVFVRHERAPPSDREWTGNSDDNWKSCLTWLKQEFDLPELDVNLQSKLVSRELFKLTIRHPIDTLWRLRAFLTMPAAYPRLARRLYWLFRQ